MAHGHVEHGEVGSGMLQSRARGAWASWRYGDALGLVGAGRGGRDCAGDVRVRAAVGGHRGAAASVSSRWVECGVVEAAVFSV